MENIWRKKIPAPSWREKKIKVCRFDMETFWIGRSCIIFRFPNFSVQNNCCRLLIRKQIIQMNWYLGLFGEVRLELNHITIILNDTLSRVHNVSMHEVWKINWTTHVACLPGTTFFLHVWLWNLKTAPNAVQTQDSSNKVKVIRIPDFTLYN